MSVLPIDECLNGKLAVSALETFERNKPRMHNFTIQFVQSLLNNKNKKGAINELVRYN